MVRDPSLQDKPVGVKQKNLMVTCNYVARSLGVKKSMWIKEALETLPNLVLIDGSDLTHYRQFSSRISEVAQTFTPSVERLGLDENFIDITDIVEDYVQESSSSEIEGHIFGDKEPSKAAMGDPCGCGCRERLITGAFIAKKMRQQILEATGITCCAGVAHNKLLAKLVSGYYKPNQQTVLFPWLVGNVMNSLNLAKSIPGIGSSTFKTLEELGIYTVKDLQNSSLTLLKSRFDGETSKKFKDLSFGIDEAPVKRSGRAQSIGLEDAFRKVSTLSEVRIKYCTLLERLMKLVVEDGRVPISLRVSVRKFGPDKKFGQRESRQLPISPSLFPAGVHKFSEKTISSLMTTVMGLFHKMVDTSREYHLTLVGVGFNKFIERATQANSITSFFSKRKWEDSSENHSDKICENPKQLKLSSEPDRNNDIDLHASVQPSSAHNAKDRCSSLIEGNSCDGMGKPDKHVSFSDNCSSLCNAEVGKPDKCVSSSGNYSSSCNIGQEIECLKTPDSIVNSKVSDVCDLKEEASGPSIDLKERKSVIGSVFCDNFQNPKNCNVQTPLNVCPCKSVTAEKESAIKLPAGVDQEVFESLPRDLQDEILLSYEEKPPDANPKPRNLPKPKVMPQKNKTGKCMTLDKYFKPEIIGSGKGLLETEVLKQVKKTATSTRSIQMGEASCSSDKSSVSYCQDPGMDNSRKVPYVATDTSCLETFLPPDGVDPGVFNSLPVHIQREIMEDRGLLQPSNDAPQNPQPAM